MNTCYYCLCIVLPHTSKVDDPHYHKDIFTCAVALKQRVAELTQQLANERAYVATLEDRLEFANSQPPLNQTAED